MDIQNITRETETEKTLWLVGYKIEEDIPHGINEAYVGIATFSSLFNAEDFIEKCMPKENHNRFFIEDTISNIRYFNFL